MRTWIFIISMLCLLIAIESCTEVSTKKDFFTTYTRTTKSDTYSGAEETVIPINIDEHVELTYTLTLDNPHDVYFALTNTNNYTTLICPQITSSNNSEAEIEKQRSQITDQPEEIGIRGESHINDFNSNPLAFKDEQNNLEDQNRIMSIPTPQYDSVNSTNTFIYDYNSSTPDSTIPATCRKIVNSASDGITLNVWVANDCWTSGGTKANLITQDMVDQLANKFLALNSTEDIYNWVTNIFGEEWGSHDYPSYCISDNNEITILLYDINGDNSTSGGVLGFYWAKDAFDKDVYSYSNERTMLYLDAVLFATKSDSTWELTTDYWPSEILSTLAHEFQHMIHFYQKAVLRSNLSNSETWLNEMCSLATEDMVAYKLGIKGPRGVDYNDGTAGSNAPYYSTRLYYYNKYNYYSLTEWSTSNTSISYGLNFAFGAYLTRNFNGATLLKNIVKSPYTDSYAITNALSSYGNTFEDALHSWAIATLLSDLSAPPADYYKYNKNEWFTSTIDSVEYKQGSINLNNYSYSPLVYTNSEDFTTNGMNKTSNLYYKAGSSISGSNTWTIRMNKGVKLSVVIK